MTACGGVANNSLFVNAMWNSNNDYIIAYNITPYNLIYIHDVYFSTNVVPQHVIMLHVVQYFTMV